MVTGESIAVQRNALARFGQHFVDDRPDWCHLVQCFHNRRNPI